MENKSKSLVMKLFVIVINLVTLLCLIWFYVSRKIIIETFLALIFLQSLIDSFLLFRYLIYKKAKRLSNKIKFQYLTIYLDQPRMEGIYKKNWWQIHFASRPYGEHWGTPRTYIKLQFKKNKKFDARVLGKYEDYNLNGFKINSIEHIKRPYKNYLLMKVMWYIFDKEKITELMDFLLKVAKESEI